MGFWRIKWYLQESNQGHTDFQSVALPTELRYLLLCVKHAAAGANINLFWRLQNKNFIFKFIGKEGVIDPNLRLN